MQTTDEILNKSPWFKQMLTRLRQQQFLQERFYALIGSPLQDMCQVSRFQDGILYLITQHTAWVSRVYYQAPQIITTLRADSAFRGIEGVRCLVAPPELIAKGLQQVPRDKIKINSRVAESLRHSADLVKDPGLQKILLRLASYEKD